jgi:N-acetylglucosaminyl-diphospho-decaprenol L-rhamnosyltransferase
MLGEQLRLTPKNLSISIVCHGHGQKVKEVLQDLQPLMLGGAQVLLTLNIPEDEKFLDELLIKPELIRNASKKGFGENHNQAFLRVKRAWFAVINPDTRIDPELFEGLDIFCQSRSIGAIAPVVIDALGNVESSARYYPTLRRLFQRVGNRLLGKKLYPDYDSRVATVASVDWISGCFMLFYSRAYDLIGGFDSRYYMYLEDADVCLRLHLAGFKVLYCTKLHVIHHGQYASRSQWRHFYWHIRSMTRFLWVSRKFKWD